MLKLDQKFVLMIGIYLEKKHNQIIMKKKKNLFVEDFQIQYLEILKN